MGITLDPYLPLFLLGLILPVVSWFVFRRTPADSGVSIGEFAGMFLRGNPFQAMGSLVRYYHARGEHEMVAMTERLSRAGSPLAVEELLEALEDPRFHVRFEALVSIARMKPDPRLTEALVSLLNGSELALSTVAAWALGRIGDDDAQGPLHEALNSEYRSIRAHSARALATLGDTEIAPLLLERIVVESDPGLRMAYASALGQLRQKEAVFPLLTLLDETENKGARIELALSLARIVGDEHNFVQLLRHVRSDAATATSQATTALRRRWRRLDIRNEELMAMAEECAVILGQGDLDGGAKLISKMIVLLPEDRLTAASQAILMACAQDLEELGASRIEYLILALHIMEVGWRK